MAIGMPLDQGEQLTARPDELTAGMNIRKEGSALDLNPGMGCDHCNNFPMRFQRMPSITMALGLGTGSPPTQTSLDRELSHDQ